MKAKFNPQKFLIDNVEKIVFGGFALLVAMLLWSAMSLEPYTKTPHEMESSADSLVQAVSSAKWDEYLKAKQAIEPPAIIDPANPPNEADLPIALWPFQNEARLSFQKVPPPPISPFLPPVERPSTKRKEPSLYTLGALEANHGFGAFAVLSAPGTPGSTVRPAAPKRDARARLERFKKVYGGPPGYPGAGGVEGATEGGSGSPPRRPGNVPAPPGTVPAAPGMRGAPAGYPGGGEGFGGNLAGAADINAQARGYQWVCVTGVIPLTKQQLEFYDKLAVTSQNVTAADYVQYTNFQVRRAVVKDASQVPAAEDWQDVDLTKLVVEMENWAPVEQPEVVRQVAIYPGLASPLPPRVDRAWTRDVVHSHFHDYVLDEQAAAKEYEEAIKRAEKEKQNRRTDRSANPFRQFTKDDGFSFGEAGASGLAGYGGGPRGENLGGGEDGDVPAPDARMFRFFDFSVEEGKTYVYSVRLELANPNFGLPEKSLDKAASAKPEFLWTNWSENSQPRTIPKSSNILVAGITRDARTKQLLYSTPSRDARVQVMVRQWNRDHGTMTSKIFGMLRGQVANFDNESVTIVKPGTGKMEEANVSFKTNLTMVDYLGGNKIKPGREYCEPCDMVFTDASGKLFAYNELNDREEFRAEEQRSTVTPTPTDGGTPTDDPLFSNTGLEGGADPLAAPKR